MRLPRNIIALSVMMILALANIENVQATCIFDSCECDGGGEVYTFVEGCKSFGNFPTRHATDKAKRVEFIDLSEMGIETIPENTLKGLRIDYIDLSGNRISSLKSNAFAGANIEQILLKDNELSRIDVDAFKPIRKNLNTLWLSTNKLSEMNIKDLTEVLSSLEELTTLGLSNNQLTHLPDLSHMVKCNDLQLAGNYLAELMQYDPDKFLLPDNLLTLSLNDNRIKEIDPRWFKNLKKLKHLSLASNQISYIDADTFKDLTNLHQLSLSKNYISHIPSGVFKMQPFLKRLDFSSQNTMLKKIDNYAFDRESDSDHQMETLDLSNNRIEQLPSKAFCSHNKDRPYVAIKTIELAANSITNLNPCIMSQLAKGMMSSISDMKYYQKPVVRFEENKAIHTSFEYVKCDCNVTNSAAVVTLEGSCMKANNLVPLGSYQCGITNALGNAESTVDALCKKSSEYTCEKQEDINYDTPEESVEFDNHYTIKNTEMINTKTEQPGGQINNVQNTHTSSNIKNDRNSNKVTKKPSQIGGSSSTTNINSNFSFIYLLIITASTLLLNRH